VSDDILFIHFISSFCTTSVYLCHCHRARISRDINCQIVDLFISSEINFPLALNQIFLQRHFILIIDDVHSNDAFK